jgi:hypothetical protein
VFSWYENWLEEMSNIAGTVSDGVKSSLDGAFSNVTSMLEGNKVSGNPGDFGSAND